MTGPIIQDWWSSENAPVQTEMFGPLGVRASDLATSHEAAASAAKHAPTNRERALLALYEHGPLSDFGLEAVTGIQQTSIGKRRLAPCIGTTHLSPSGAKTQVWRLTAAGEELAKGMRS